MKLPPTIGQLLDAVDRLASAPPSKTDAAWRALDKIAKQMPTKTTVVPIGKVLAIIDKPGFDITELETAANAARVWALSVGVLDGWL